MIEKAQAQIQVQASAQAQQIEDMGQLSIIGCLSFVITFEYFLVEHKGRCRYKYKRCKCIKLSHTFHVT